MEEVFDEQAVLDLIKEALAADGNDAFKPERSLPLGLGHGRLLEMLCTKLEDAGMAQADIQQLLDDMRTELYAGISLGDLRDVHRVTRNCRKCPIAVPDPHLPKWNLSDPDCVFVTDVPFHSKDAADVLVSTLVNAGFSSKRVALTYVNRCPVAKGERYTYKEVSNCLPYLHTELQLLQPKLIVTLGLLATSAVLGADIKLADERGEVRWLGPWAIMPVYHPNYLMKSGEGNKEIFEQDISRAFGYVYGRK